MPSYTAAERRSIDQQFERATKSQDWLKACVIAAEAAAHNYLDLYNRLMERRIDSNFCLDGKTALMLAAEEGNLEAARFLLDELRDFNRNAINQCDKEGYNALDHAILNEHEAICYLFWNSHFKNNSVALKKINEILDRNLPLQALPIIHFLIHAYPSLKMDIWFNAFYKHRLDMAEELLEQYQHAIPIDEKRHGMTALMYAAKAGFVRGMVFLLDKGASLTLVDASGFNALDHALFGNQVAAAKYLWDEGVRPRSDFDIFEGFDAPDFALLENIAKNNLNHVDATLKQIDSNHKNAKGNTLLMIAAFLNPNLKMIDLFIKSGANIWVQNHQGHTAFMWAAFKGHLGIVEFLYRRCLLAGLKRADDASYPTLKEKVDKQMSLALDFAMFGSHFSTWKFLFERGARSENINRFDIHGMRPLVVAARRGEKELVFKMLAAGANVNLANNQYSIQDSGETVLMAAVRLNDPRFIQRLVEEAGANVHPNVMSGAGETIYSLASQQSPELFAFLNTVTKNALNLSQHILSASDKKSYEPGQTLRHAEPGWVEDRQERRNKELPIHVGLELGNFWVGKAKFKQMSASIEQVLTDLPEDRPSTPMPGRKK